MGIAAVMGNVGRVLAWWRRIAWRPVVAYALPGVPAAALGAHALLTIPPAVVDSVLVPGVRSLLPISGAQMAPRGVVVGADTTTVSAPPPPCDASIWITEYLARTSDAGH
jgi:uncharacterized membrane protein YfcA